jgi:acetylornithine deacetylase/succinyl-diaminopimelate desuccinylase-like protein
MPIQQYLSENRPRMLGELKEWLRIPSISALPQHREDVQLAAEWLAASLVSAGLEHVTLIPSEQGGHPLVYADWLHAGEDKPTVLIYGHFDVQPVDPVAKWRTPPFEPTVVEDNLFCRGAADDKGQTFIHVKAVETLLRATGTLPVNVKFLVEGEEEFGGETITAYVPAHAAALAADCVLISDSHILSTSQPTLLYGLRGMWAGEITVTGPTTDLHSGAYGGVVHNPNQALAEILAQLHDATGRVAVPGFYDDVDALAPAERAALAKSPYGEDNVRHESGVPQIYGEPAFSVVERIGARPTLEINGMWGGFTGDGFKTVTPAEAHAKISCRLVPSQDPAQVDAVLRTFIAQITPPTVAVTVHSWHGAPAFLSPIDSAPMQAAARAYRTAFGVDPIFTREGGSIPVGSVFQQALGTPVIFMGFGLPDDNLHAPNEKFSLPMFYKGIETVIAFLGEMAG